MWFRRSSVRIRLPTFCLLAYKNFAAGYSCRESQYILGCSQVVRHQTLTLAFRRFEPCQPSLFCLIYWDIAKLVRHRILIPAFRRFESFWRCQKRTIILIQNYGSFSLPKTAVIKGFIKKEKFFSETSVQVDNVLYKIKKISFWYCFYSSFRI